VFIFPLLGHALHLSDSGFGLWAGTAINDTSSVVAASYSYSKAAGDFATVTKLARTTMIVPIALGFALWVRRRQCGGQYCFRKVFPWFILGFLAAALVNTSGLLGADATGALAHGGKLLIVVALAGVGLGANFAKMLAIGARPILMGLLVWVLVALTSLGIQVIGHQM
jgi:uncharacterized membrane protein YadS